MRVSVSSGRCGPCCSHEPTGSTITSARALDVGEARCSRRRVTAGRQVARCPQCSTMQAAAAGGGECHRLARASPRSPATSEAPVSQRMRSPASPGVGTMTRQNSGSRAEGAWLTCLRLGARRRRCHPHLDGGAAAASSAGSDARRSEAVDPSTDSTVPARRIEHLAPSAVEAADATRNVPFAPGRRDQPERLRPAQLGGEERRARPRCLDRPRRRRTRPSGAAAHRRPRRDDGAGETRLGTRRRVRRGRRRPRAPRGGRPRRRADRPARR